ncbi:hypothetical protein [Streptomyces tubercidicus]
MAQHVYGVYLRPDTRTSVAITNVTLHVERQFGLVSAGAFPPHATLAGAIPSNAGPDKVIATLDPVIAGVQRFPVHNAGIAKHNIAIAYDINTHPDGTVNQPLTSLALAINDAFTPLAESADGYLVKPFVPEQFRAHLSLASHELQVNPGISAEVEEFIRELPFEPSSGFEARYITLYRFHSTNWAGHWWTDLTWDHLHTWELPPR